MEGNTSNGGKPGVLGSNKKNSTEKGIPSEDLVGGKLATSKGNPILESSVDRKGYSFARLGKAESLSKEFFGEKMEGNISNGGKTGVLGSNKKNFSKKGIPSEDLVVGKLPTFEGNPILEPSVDRKGVCFQSGAIKRKMSGNEGLPSAKRALFKNERVDISKCSGKNEFSHFTGGKKNNLNLNIIRPGSVRADNCIPSTPPPCDNMNQSQVIKFNGSGDVSKSSSTGTEDSTNNRIATHGMNFKHNNTSLISLPPRRRALWFLKNEECRTPVHHATTATLRECSGSERKSDMQPKSCSNFPQNGSLSDMGKNFIGNVSSRVNKRPKNVTSSSESIVSCYSGSRLHNAEVNALKRSTDLLTNSNSAKRKNCNSACPTVRAANNELEILVNSRYTDNLGSLKALEHLGRKEDPYGAPFGNSCKAFETSHFSCSPSIAKKRKISVEKSSASALPKSNISVLVPESRFNLNFSAHKEVLAVQRSDVPREATADSADSADSADCKLTCSTMSMKQLIAAAQAKKRLAHSRQWIGNSTPTDHSKGSSEAEAAREALEGMIETLSRSRESIRRATRHAIDCAKYGIADEVVELLVHKLEDEPSLSHRIDLFFLVDSITQCSQTLKEASYVPVVQAALPRILGAAAPSGSAAQENRRQCLKVLRLWRERRLLPEYILSRYMDEIEARNDRSNTEFSIRIPSCAEQCVDDPLREVESLQIDQYGSNTTFLFAGISSAYVLKEDEDFPSTPCNGTADFSPHKSGGVSVAVPGFEGLPLKAHHHRLEHVENEIEMEDELTPSSEGISIGGGSSYSFAPLPLDPPPSPPPLPSSPPPPTPPPPSSPPPVSPPTVSSRHQVSYSSPSFQQCGETIRQMPPHSSLPASGHLSHGNMSQHHLQQKYSHHASTLLPGQGTCGAKDQCMSHPGDADQGYSDAWNQGGRPSSSLSVPFVQDGDSFPSFTHTSFRRPT